MTTIYEATLGPSDEEVMNTQLTGKIAKDFVAMLNMNKVRDHYGHRLTFRWTQPYSNSKDWTLEATVHYDD